MLNLDITLKYSPIPVSIQKETKEAAEELYGQITRAMGDGNATLIELTCDKFSDKKIAIMSDQISAVVLSSKEGASNAGRAPGFFAALQQS